MGEGAEGGWRGGGERGDGVGGRWYGRGCRMEGGGEGRLVGECSCGRGEGGF